MQRSDTQAISIDAPPCAVIDLVSDAAEFPRWAAGFARAVQVDGDDWIVDTGEGEGRLFVRVSREIGAFSRVVPNGRGSDFVFTQFFADDMGEAELADQRAVTAVELQTVRAL